MDLALPLLLYLPDTAKVSIGAALGLGAIVTALFYMLAYALQHPPLLALAKEELSALLYSAVIIIFWIASSSTVDPIALALIAPSNFVAGQHISDLSTSHVTLAIGSLDIMLHKLREMYVSLYLYEALIGFLSTISFPLGSPMPGPAIISFSLMPFDGLNLLSNAHTIVVESIGQMMTFVWAKQFILLFCRDAIPIIFLPLGLAFRAIPFFRSTGSSIISICFVGFFVLPLAVLFSNYLIFDVYKPADFVYAPQHIGPYKSDLSQDAVNASLTRTKTKSAEEITKLFTTQNTVASTSTSSDSCAGNFIWQMLCSAVNVAVGIGKGIYEFGATVWGIWKFMMGMTGDFLSVWSNPLLPASATAGLYYFIIDEVVVQSQFLVLILVTSVIEIIFTITMYRNISMIIGGELEIAGLSKII